MAATALDYISTTTQKRVIPYMVDQVAKTNTTLNLLVKNATFLDGGDFITQPVLTSLPTGMVISYSGSENFPINSQNNEQGAVFDWKFYGIAIDIQGPDEVRNDGVAAILNLVKIRMQTAEVALKQVLGTDLQGDGTGAGNPIIGFKAAIDDGTSYDNYGGISRAAYPVWKAYKNANGSVNRALTTSLLDAMYQNTSWDSDCPNLNVTTLGLLTKFGTSLYPIQRTERSDLGVQGYTNLSYRGFPVISDMQVSTSPEEWLGLNMRYAQMYFKRGRFFKWVPFQRLGRADTLTGLILVAMCFLISRPASFGRITDLSSTL